MARDACNRKKRLSTKVETAINNVRLKSRSINAVHTSAAVFATVVLYPEIVVRICTRGGRVVLAVGDRVFTCTRGGSGF